MGIVGWLSHNYQYLSLGVVEGLLAWLALNYQYLSLGVVEGLLAWLVLSIFYQTWHDAEHKLTTHTYLSNCSTRVYILG